MKADKIIINLSIDKRVNGDCKKGISSVNTITTLTPSVIEATANEYARFIKDYLLQYVKEEDNNG